MEKVQAMAEQVEIKAKVVKSEVKALVLKHKKALEERECELLWKVSCYNHVHLWQFLFCFYLINVFQVSLAELISKYQTSSARVDAKCNCYLPRMFFRNFSKFKEFLLTHSETVTCSEASPELYASGHC